MIFNFFSLILFVFDYFNYSNACQDKFEKSGKILLKSLLLQKHHKEIMIVLNTVYTLLKHLQAVRIIFRVE